MKLLIIVLITGFIQMSVAHLVGLHGDLPHMQFTHVWQYAFESLFYSFCHWLIAGWVTGKG